MKKAIREFFSRLFRYNRAPDLPHRESDADLGPEMMRIMIAFMRRDERSVRSKVRWRRFSLLLVIVISLFSWMKWQEQVSKELLIDQKPFRTLSVTGSGWSTAHVAVIPIRGTINGDPLGPAEVSNTPRYLHDTLQLAKKQSNLAAIVIYIESGGGDMYASTESYRLVHNFTKSTKIPVYAYVPRSAYSGAYYIALGTGEIIADPVAEIGNIGVIVERLKTYGFGRRFGIEMQAIKTGPHKDGGQWKRPNAGDRAIDQRVIDVMFEQFLQAVVDSRPNYSLDELKAAAKKQGGVSSGAWFVASDAMKKGLIDKSMTFEEFLIYVTKNIAQNDKRKFRDVEFVKYDEKLSILDDWKEQLKSPLSLSSTSKQSAKEDIGSCMLATSILDQIFKSDK